MSARVHVKSLIDNFIRLVRWDDYTADKQATEDRIDAHAVDLNDPHKSSRISEAKPTGLVDGGELNIGPQPFQVEILAGFGIVLDSYSDPLVKPADLLLSWDTINVPIVIGNPVTGTVIYITIKESIPRQEGPIPAGYTGLATTALGVIEQYTSAPSPSVLKDEIYLGILIYNGDSWGEISSPIVVNNAVHALDEFLNRVAGPTFIIDGGGVSEQPAFTLAREQGTIWELNRNWHNDKKDPHRENLAADPVLEWRYVNRDFSYSSSLLTTVDPSIWDNGVIPPSTVPDPVGTATVQRLYIDPRDNLWVLLGQNTYATFLEAAALIGADTAATVIPPVLSASVLLGYIVATKGDTDWTAGSARFIAVGSGAQNGSGGSPITDHGNLAGLGDDDHSQYLRADGTRALTGNMAVSASATIDGRDISVDGAKLDTITFDNASIYVSTFGASLIDDPNAASGRLTLDAEKADVTLLKQADILDLPVNNVLIQPISSNWAFDHTVDNNAHGGPYNNYAHPTYTSRSVDTANAEVIDVLTSDASGHVTGATKRTMTLAQLGYTGAVDANKYIHAAHPGDDFSVDSGALAGASIISDIDINVTTDTEGHVTDANGVIATRELTASDIGASSDTHNHTGVYLPIAGKAADSSKLNGSTESVTDVADTIVKRDTAGYVSVETLKSNAAFTTDDPSAVFVADPTGVFQMKQSPSVFIEKMGLVTGFKNIVINGDFRINQRNFNGDWGNAPIFSYGYDRWRKEGNSAGMTAAYAIQQHIEPESVSVGYHTLSWEGGAEGVVSINAAESVPAFSPVTVWLDNPTALYVKVPYLSTNIQFEYGSTATRLEMRPISLELSLCQRYYAANFGQIFATVYHSNLGKRFMSVTWPHTLMRIPDMTYTISGGTIITEFITMHSMQLSMDADSQSDGVWVTSIIADAEF